MLRYRPLYAFGTALAIDQCRTTEHYGLEDNNYLDD